MTSMSPTSVVNSGSAATSNQGSVSPRQTVLPKNVAFELLFTESPQYRARLPMRVQIYPHDTTDSIVTTVKNFYGLYSGPTGSKGVSFEDENGITLIARYENFRNNMVVYVRVIEESPSASSPFVAPTYHNPPLSAQQYFEGNGYPLQPPPRFGQEISRPSSSTSRRRSPSPNAGRGRRSGSAHTNPKKGRSRSSKNLDTAASNGHTDIYSDSVNGYSSGDGAPESSSSRMKEQIGNTEISLENIVEGGRRKRAKFESSELPLFAPPQMPAATSNPSVSPARRAEPQRASLPFVHPGQNPFTNPIPLQSPQSHNNGYAQGGYYATPSSERHSRGSIGYAGQSGNFSGMSGILPTPDPTVGSCMSEEDKDVAIQLMRLGEMSNISHGRTSASTLDDTFSGRADAASSTGATSDGESESDEESAARRQKLDAAGVMRKIYQTTESHFIPQPSIETHGDDVQVEKAASHVVNGEGKPEVLKNKTNLPDAKPKTQLPGGSKPKTSKVSKVPRPTIPKPKKASAPASASASASAPASNGPMSPASLPPSRKPSIASAAAASGAPGEDDQLDLSAKPRCQRCRKSKKGCDRQRPCGRCRDAGLNADQCISEDEGNGRKGRYGRHMGVPIKKEDIVNPTQPTLLPAAPIATTAAVADKNKKRKR
ncbi:hypothetical protein CORC01_11530 [Colletotrichum orchidophilum]|uniref:Zn(2)-C6 fungal-type domain-containing protein n=1 Tax=Colletotrichum orchidophilum TaxID=1209926 RepID=A0A1G4AVV6_9PEZI|nr:uncharacterized protein CORC01_11530 [Colletotrichum orchidophilum]OHE93213.1 hypothetical protein CORC01_11530 [Colletotrichum orchidophilum]